MSAVAEPTKPYAKKPTKWQWRLAAGRLSQGVAAAQQGRAIAVMSLTAYMTARDVANALRCEPHVAQGILMKLLAKRAVERRIIPGSIYDTSSTKAPPAPKLSGTVTCGGNEGLVGAPLPVVAPSPKFILGTRIKHKTASPPGNIYDVVKVDDNTADLRLVGDGHNHKNGQIFTGKPHYLAAYFNVVEVESKPAQFKVGDFVEVHGSKVPAKVLKVDGAELKLQHGDTGYEWTTINLGHISAWPSPSLVPGFDPRIVPGSIIESDTAGRWIVVGLKSAKTLRVRNIDGHEGCATYCYLWRFVGQTPNPVAFNKGNYKDCFNAPKEEAPTYPFAVGEEVFSKQTGKKYKVKAFSSDAKTMTLLDSNQNAQHFCLVGEFAKAPPVTPARPLTPIQEEAKKIVDEIVDGPKPKALTIADFGVGDKVRISKSAWPEDHGATGVVKEVQSRSVCIERDDKGCCIYWTPGSLEIVEKAKPVEVNTDEGRKDDAGKPPLQFLLKYFDARALGAVAEVMDYGAGRYGERNWEKPQLSKERILGAVLRHVGNDLRGDKVDADSKKLHLAHAAASALMALSKEMGVCNASR